MVLLRETGTFTQIHRVTKVQNDHQQWEDSGNRSSGEKILYSISGIKLYLVLASSCLNGQPTAKKRKKDQEQKLKRKIKQNDSSHSFCLTKQTVRIRVGGTQ